MADTCYDFEKTLLLNYKKIGITDDEALILLITHSLVSQGSKFVNPTDLAFLCSFSTTKIDVVYSSLTSKGYIKTDILNDGTVITSFDKIYGILATYANPKKEEIKDNGNLFKYMENFFERLLTPLEYDVIQSWKDKNYSLDFIKSACEIASLSGNKSIKYIDTIIFEETKKEELGAEEYQKRNQETIDISTIDWLNK